TMWRACVWNGPSETARRNWSSRDDYRPRKGTMRKPSVFIIFLTVFIDLVGFGMVLPLLPIFAKTFSASGFAIGALMASFSAVQFLFAPLWGRLSDRVGRRPVLLVSTAGAMISYAIFALG